MQGFATSSLPLAGALLIFAWPAGCDDEGGTAPAGADVAADAATDAGVEPTLVCPDFYIQLITTCQRGSPDDRLACREALLASTLATSRPAARDVLECIDDTCGESPGASLQPCIVDRCCGALNPCLALAYRVRNPCPDVEPTEQGIGTPCTEKAECDGLPGWNCPYSIPPPEDREHYNLPRWCSHLCEADADCGEGAFCWHRRSPYEQGACIPVGSCAPLACVEVDAAKPSE